MTPIAAEDIRARKRPSAILFVFFAELAWALLVATPVHAWARRVWGAHPDGDAVLFARGGRDLMMWLGQNDAGIGVTVRTTIVLFAVGAVLMQLPFAAMLSSLAFSRDEEGKSMRIVPALRVGIGAFLPLSALLALGSVTAVIVLALGGIASSAVDHGFAESLGDARSFALRIVTFGLFAVLACLVGVFVDLARAAVAREVGLAVTTGTESSAWSIMLRGVKTAFGTSRRGLRRATLAWAARMAIGLVLIAIGYVAAEALGGRGGMALVTLFVTHQAIVLARVALRASWMARALALVAPVQDEAANTPST